MGRSPPPTVRADAPDFEAMAFDAGLASEVEMIALPQAQGKKCSMGTANFLGVLVTIAGMALGSALAPVSKSDLEGEAETGKASGIRTVFILGGGVAAGAPGLAFFRSTARRNCGQ